MIDLTPYFRLSQPLEHVYVTQGFGEQRIDYTALGATAHMGVDYRAVTGTPCFAVIDGTITVAGQDWQGGRVVRLQTDPVEVDGKKYRLEFIYYHLQEWSVLAGERVYRGQQVGLTDNTGKYSTAPHLHFGMEIHWFEDGLWKKDSNNGYWGCFDPKPFFTYKPTMENPYGIPANTLIQLTEGVGGFSLWSGEKFYVDSLDKIIASWLVRNKGKTDGKTMAVAQVVWDAYPKFNLKNQPI